MQRDMWGRPVWTPRTPFVDRRPSPGPFAPAPPPGVRVPLHAEAPLPSPSSVPPARPVARDPSTRETVRGVPSVSRPAPPEPVVDDSRTPPPPSSRGPSERAEAPQPVDALVDRALELKRATDELEAMKGRLERDAKRAEEATRTQLVTELFPVLDNLDRTLAAGSADAALLEGVKMVRSQLEGVLERFGVEPIAAVGERFNPAEHDAVAMAPVNDVAEDGVVLDAFSRGYRFGGRVVVPARVRVGKLAG